MSLDLKKYKKVITGIYTDETAIFVGKFKVAGYYYNGARPHNDPKVYKVSSPVFNAGTGSFETEEQAWKRCEQLADKFIEWITYKKGGLAMIDPNDHDAWKCDPEWDAKPDPDDRDDYDIQCERWETETDD